MMNTRQLVQRSTFGAWKRIVRVVVTRPAAAPMVSATPDGDSAAYMYAQELFVQALCDDSNYELEWLWLATQVQREHERRYCFERVLHINPDNRTARRALAQLAPIPTHMRRMIGSR